MVTINFFTLKHSWVYTLVYVNILEFWFTGQYSQESMCMLHLYQTKCTSIAILRQECNKISGQLENVIHGNVTTEKNYSFITVVYLFFYISMTQTFLDKVCT